MYDLNRNAGETPGQSELAPTVPYCHARNIDAASFLYWGEHCIECAEPDCFQTCDLYVSRPDGRCRRFTRGIVRNPRFPSARGYGAEISFKRWGKLETRGNSALIGHRWLMSAEKLVAGLRPALDFLGAVVWRVSGDSRWRSITSRIVERAIRKLHARRRTRPDAFLLEIFNPSDIPVVLHVNFAVTRKELITLDLDAKTLLPVFRRRLELPAGYSRHEISYDQLSPVTESGLPFNISLTPEADSDPTLIFLCADFVRFAQKRIVSEMPHGAGATVKCVVLDLDNTVWRGTLLEDVRVYPDPKVLGLIRTLDQRGILISVASKNDFALAVAKMKEIGIEEYILYPQINWLPKSEGIRTIARKLNIGLDTFIFVDDSEFELDEVTRALPMVTCINTRDIASLLRDPRLRGSKTLEARRRRLMYREAMVREEEERRYGEDFFGFLRSCNIKLRLLPYNEKFFDRVCELLQRTNQLNFSGRKYRREETVAILADSNLEKWVIECSDRFGSYGIVGFSLVARRAEAIWIEDLMLSCRVQGRFVEQALFHALVAGDPSVNRIEVNFTATGRNTPARQVLEAMGFEPVEGENRMYLDLQKRELVCDFIELESGPEAPDRYNPNRSNAQLYTVY
jgi:FkbH-like protein